MKQLRQTLLKIGDSLVLVKDQEILKIHIHTNKTRTSFRKTLNLWHIKGKKN